MTKTQAIAKFAAVYSKYLDTITVGGSKDAALAYAVQDVINQTKHLSAKMAAFQINDEADYLQERMR